MDLEPDPIYDPVSSLSHENPYPAYERLREDFPSNTSRVTTFGRCRGMRTSSRGYVIGRPFPTNPHASWFETSPIPVTLTWATRSLNVYPS